VQLFYMVSAFTLCLSLDEKRRERYPIFNYFIRRFFRIAPLFYVVILVNLLARIFAPFYSSLGDLRPGEILLGFFFLNGISPRAINNVVSGGWSIAVETSFYLVLPILHRYALSVRRSLKLFTFTAPVLGTLSVLLAIRQRDPVHVEYFLFYWFPVEFPVFILGILSYCIWKKYIGGGIGDTEKQREISLLLIGSSFMLYCGCLPFTDVQVYFSSFIFLPLILGLSIRPWPAFVNHFTRFIGKISYSLYLLHFFILGWISSALRWLDERPNHLPSRYIFHRLLGVEIVFPVALIISVPICTLSWRYIEQSGIQLGRQLIAWREGRRPADT
jgi:peptidoglycan/LPS O-acetylase OafA/YrhL